MNESVLQSNGCAAAPKPASNAPGGIGKQQNKPVTNYLSKNNYLKAPHITSA